MSEKKVKERKKGWYITKRISCSAKQITYYDGSSWRYFFGDGTDGKPHEIFYGPFTAEDALEKMTNTKAKNINVSKFKEAKINMANYIDWGNERVAINNPANRILLEKQLNAAIEQRNTIEILRDYTTECDSKIAEQAKEIEKLKAALKEIADSRDGSGLYPAAWRQKEWKKVTLIASKALEGD